MTITMDKKIIFSNIDEWEEFCKYANSHLRWTNPRLADSFEAWQFNEYRKKDVWLTTNLKETVFVDYLFIGIKGNEVFIFVHRTPTKEEVEELTFNAEDFI